MACMLVLSLTHTHTHIQTGIYAHTLCWTVSPFKQKRRGRKRIMAKQKAPERQLVLVHEVTMEYVCFLCRCSCMFVWLSGKVCIQVPNCVCVSHYACIAAGCMYACQSAYLLSNQTHAACVCIVAVTLLLPKTDLYTLTHNYTHTPTNTHTQVGIWVGICIGSTVPMSGIHTKSQRAVIQTQPLMCVCVCVSVSCTRVMKGPSHCACVA